MDREGSTHPIQEMPRRNRTPRPWRDLVILAPPFLRGRGRGHLPRILYNPSLSRPRKLQLLDSLLSWRIGELVQHEALDACGDCSVDDGRLREDSAHTEDADDSVDAEHAKEGREGGRCVGGLVEWDARWESWAEGWGSF